MEGGNVSGGWIFFSKTVSVTSRLLERWEYLRTVLTYQLNVKWKKWIIRFCYLCSFKKKNLVFFQEIPPQVSNRPHHQRHTLYPSQSFKSPSQNPEIQNQNGGSTINYDIEAIKLDRHSDFFQNICPEIIY